MESRDISILIIEDQLATARLLDKQLKQAGFETKVVATAEEGLMALDQQPFQLILLDLQLPGMDGFQFIATMRVRHPRMPVLILSARPDVESRIEGLNLGADDFLTKPYDNREMLARVDAILKRTAQSGETMLEMETLRVDLLERIVERRGRRIQLTPKEFSLLAFLLKNKGRVVTREELLKAVWELDFDPGTNVLDVSISRLRKSLNEGNEANLILTVTGEGFTMKEPAP